MKKSALFILLTLACIGRPAWAAEGGYSNYVPGFYGDLMLAVAPPDGWSMRNDLYFYGADGSGSVRSGQVEVEADFSIVYDYLTLLYKPGFEFLGGEAAFGIVPTVGYVDIESSIRSGEQKLDVSDNSLGFGDLTGAAMFYWNKGKFNYAWGNYVVAPTGSYNPDRLANTGLNIWTIETDFLFTYVDEEKGRDFSLVTGYNYNFENKDTHYKSGNEFHVDFVLNQFLSDSWAIGIGGFYLKQLSGDSGTNAVLGDFKSEAMGIGPNLYYIREIRGTSVAFILKWINEFNVENRLKGDHVFASFALSF